MNLKLHLVSRIAAVALMCLFATVVYVLHRSEQQSRTIALNTLDSLAKQLEFQLLRNNAGYQPTSPFPDFDLWKQTSNTPGVCIRYESSDKDRARGLCKGVDVPTHSWPFGFEKAYRLLLNPDFEWRRRIAFNGHVYGMLTVSTSAEMAIAHAWDNVGNLLGLSVITILTVCLLVYLVVSRALRPAPVIVAGLRRMEQGELSYRLPDFELIEWQQTASAINQLAENQRLLLNERQKLLVMLMNVQEEERRYLARELHDELGQCLTAINAVVTSIGQTAEQHCPALMAEVRQISRFTDVMQKSVRGLLTRLRPMELESLGLAASLRSLVSRWNRLDSGKTRYQLNISGDCTQLPEPLSITLFRIIQEGINNIAKHAAATQADISLAITADDVRVIIKDNGTADVLPFADGPGIGLLGLRERVIAMNGTYTLAIAKPHGLIIDIRLQISWPEGAAL